MQDTDRLETRFLSKTGFLDICGYYLAAGADKILANPAADAVSGTVKCRCLDEF